MAKRDKSSKPLVVFYSRSGHTRRLAEQIAAALGAEIEEIRPKNKFNGLIGAFIAGFQAASRTPAKINKPKFNPSLYSQVIIGTPVWAGSISSPVLSYLMQNLKGIKNYGFFCTMKSSGHLRVFKQVEGLIGKPPIATLALSERRLNGCEKELRDFVGALSKKKQSVTIS